MKSFIAILSLAVASQSFAQTPAANTESPSAPLLELLEQIRTDRVEEQQANQQREADFLADRNRQQQLLKQALDELKRQEDLSESLRVAFDQNEKKLAEMETQLKMEMGNIGEIFGTVRQVSGDARAVFQNSLVSSQITDRVDFVSSLAERKELPSIDELERLWYELFQEVVESGRIAKYTTKVLTPNGEEQTREVIRIGTFNAISDGKFLSYLTEEASLYEMARQPPPRYLDMASDFSTTSDDYAPMIVDPSGGTILASLTRAPNLREQVEQGKLVGYVIISIGVFGVIIAIIRFFGLTLSGFKINAQLKSQDLSEKNPLGRVMSVYKRYEEADVETLELKLDEAILKETPHFERGLPTIKILAAIAPLLGLLGTVIGMIQTFQDITLFGTGDPKIMAGGISQALMTTVLGLVVAIPLVLLHSVLAGKSDKLVQILDERSAGIMADQSEKAHQ